MHRVVRYPGEPRKPRTADPDTAPRVARAGSPEGLSGAIDQQAFWSPADAQRRGVAQPGAGELLNSERHVRVGQDVDVDGSHAAADNTDAAVRPAGPCRNLDFSGWPLSMTVPFGVIDPCAALVPARLLAAGRDGQDGIAVGQKARAMARHEGRTHQNGHSDMSAASSRRWSQ